MPAFIKTPAQERLWEKAKGLAEEAGHKEDWAYVTGIYKRLHGGKVAGEVPQKVKDQVDALLKGYKGKEVPDDQVHTIAEKGGVSPHDLESYIYSLASEHLMEKKLAQRVANRFLAEKKTAAIMADLSGYSPKLVHEAKGDFFKEVFLASGVIPLGMPDAKALRLLEVLSLKVSSLLALILHSEYITSGRSFTSDDYVIENADIKDSDTLILIEMPYRNSDETFQTDQRMAVSYAPEITGSFRLKISTLKALKVFSNFMRKLKKDTPWKDIPQWKYRFAKRLCSISVLVDKSDIPEVVKVLEQLPNNYVSVPDQEIGGDDEHFGLMVYGDTIDPINVSPLEIRNMFIDFQKMVPISEKIIAMNGSFTVLSEFNE